MNEMKRAYSSDDVRELIEARLKAEHDEATRMEGARLDGLAEGLQEAAARMLASGIDRETILDVLGLPPDALD